MQTSENIGILALKTDIQDYKLAFELQEILDASVLLAKEYTEFAVYRVNIDNINFLLIKNKSENRIFFPKLKEFGYIAKLEVSKITQLKLKLVSINIFVMEIKPLDIPKKYLKTLSLIE